MATQVQNRRGSTSEHASFTGAVGEITVDTDKDVVVVHDGSTAGGHPALKQDGSNSALALGSASSPSLKFTGDTNTGLFSPGSDQLALATGGTGRLFVDASGNVGVGGSPSVQFQVTQNQATYSYFDFYNITAGGGIVWRQIVRNIANSGTTSIDFVKYLAGGFGIVNNDTNAANFTAFNVGASERMRLDSSGRLGLGTSTATERLTVAGNISLSAAQPYISLVDSGWGAGTVIRSGVNTLGTATGDYQLFNVPTGKGFAFAQNNTANSLVIDASNRVGIGTTTVAGKLHTVLDSGFIAGQAWDSKTAIFGTASSGALGIAYDDTNGADISSIIPLVAYKPLKLRGSELVFNIQGNEKAKLDTSGRLLVGTSTSFTSVDQVPSIFLASTDNVAGAIGVGQFASTNFGAYCDLIRSDSGTKGQASGGAIPNNGTIGGFRFNGSDGVTFRAGATISAQAEQLWASGDCPTRLVFSTTADGASSPTERMRISNLGFVPFYSQDSNVLYPCSSKAAGTSDNIIVGTYGATAVNTGTASFVVRTNGDVQNTNNSYGALSDLKLKENIVDANSQWDDLKALQVRNYNFKEGQTHTQIGLVAQEVELVSPGLVTESPDRDEEGNDLGTVTKSVNYSVLYMKAIKALQEAMERIETLEAKVAALEAQ